MKRRVTTHDIARIAHISYAPLVYKPARNRLKGYRLALRTAKIRFDKRLFAEGDFTGESGYKAMKQIFASDAEPTALFAGNDTLALGAMMAIREAGLSIPEDFAVVDYDDIPGAAFAHPHQSVLPLELTIRESLWLEIQSPEKGTSHGGHGGNGGHGGFVGVR